MLLKEPLYQTSFIVFIYQIGTWLLILFSIAPSKHVLSY